MFNKYLKNSGAFIVAGSLALGAATASASQAEVDLRAQGETSHHAALTPEATEKVEGNIWPAAAAVAVALLTMERDLTSDSPNSPYTEVAFD